MKYRFGDEISASREVEQHNDRYGDRAVPTRLWQRMSSSLKDWYAERAWEKACYRATDGKTYRTRRQFVPQEGQSASDRWVAEYEADLLPRPRYYPTQEDGLTLGPNLSLTGLSRRPYIVGAVSRELPRLEEVMSDDDSLRVVSAILGRIAYPVHTASGHAPAPAGAQHMTSWLTDASRCSPLYHYLPAVTPKLALAALSWAYERTAITVPDCQRFSGGLGGRALPADVAGVYATGYNYIRTVMAVDWCAIGESVSSSVWNWGAELEMWRDLVDCKTVSYVSMKPDGASFVCTLHVVNPERVPDEMPPAFDPVAAYVHGELIDRNELVLMTSENDGPVDSTDDDESDEEEECDYGDY